MVVAALVPHVSGETSHAAFHVVTNRPIISALFHDVFVAFSLHRSFSFVTVKALSSTTSSDSIDGRLLQGKNRPNGLYRFPP